MTKKLSGEWSAYKEQYVQCSDEACEVWNVIRVKEDVELEDAGFLCGLCAFREVKVLKDKLNKESVAIQVGKEVEKLRSDLDNKTQEIETSVNENNRRWETVQKTNLTKHERLIKENMRKEIKLVGEDERRKKRVVVFGLNEEDGTSNKEQAERLLSKLNIGEDVVITDIFRLKKKEDMSKDKPLMIEFDSENVKWKVLKNKASLKNLDGYVRVFLEMDLSIEERMERGKKFRELKKKKEDQENANEEA